MDIRNTHFTQVQKHSSYLSFDPSLFVYLFGNGMNFMIDRPRPLVWSMWAVYPFRISFLSKHIGLGPH